MAQQFGALAALAEGQGSIPTAHVRRFAMAYNSSSRRYNVLVYLGYQHTRGIHEQKDTHTHK